MRCRMAVVTVLVALCVTGNRLASFGQVGRTYSLGPMIGTVVDPRGVPAAGVRVQLIGGIRDDVVPVVLHQTQTDSRGRFEIAGREYRYLRDSHGSAIVVRDAQGRVGGTSRIPLRTGRAEPAEIRIKLIDVRTYRGRLVDVSGEAIAGAQIKPSRWAGGNIGERTLGSFGFSPDMIRQSTGQTAEDGSFVLPGLPNWGSMTAVIAAPGFGSPSVTFTLNKRVTIPLERAGSVRGSVVAEKTVGDVGGVTLCLSAVPERPRTGDVDYLVDYYQEIAPDDRGAFRFPAVPAGKYVIGRSLHQNWPSTVNVTSTIDVKPGAEVTVSVPLKRAIVIRGQVVDKKSGQGIKGVLLHHVDVNGRMSWPITITDDQGAYVLYCLAGNSSVRVMWPGEGYLMPDPGGAAGPIDVTQDMTWPRIELEPAAVVEGIAVDESGRPVAGAEIRPAPREFHPIRSDKAGEFVVKLGAPKAPLHIRVRTGTAASDGPVVVVPEEATMPLKIVISPKNAFTLRGTLVDDVGRPVPAAQLHLWTSWPQAGSFPLLSATTDQTGRFEFGGLWPRDTYWVEVEPEGHEECSSRQVTAAAGQTHDLARLVLTSARCVVEGKVVDSASNPLSGVEVFNVGDGPRASSTTSDAGGRFSLEGLRSGIVYVFARRAGYRFTGVQTHDGAGDVQIRLLRKDEPVPARLQPDYPSFAEQQQIARAALERLWREDRTRTRTAVRAMARLDPQQAVRWWRESGGLRDPAVPSIVAESDLEEALASVAAEGSDDYYHAFKTLAERLATSDRAKAMRCAEQMAVQARNKDRASRAVCLAEAGSLIARLGNEPVGRKLVDEAAEMVGTMGTGKSHWPACAAVATFLAAFDPDRAVKLLNPIGDTIVRNRYIEDVAIAAARHDLATAQEILRRRERRLSAASRAVLGKSLKMPTDSRLGLPSYARRAVAPFAYQLALSQPDDALRLIDESCDMRDGSGAPAKAEALGWVAVAVAPRDQQRAWTLIDQALDLCVRPDSTLWGVRGGRPTRAALLALQASQVKYPDMESVIHRVLAARPAGSPSREPESHVVMAMILALVDPETARDVLKSLEPHSEAIVSGGGGIGRDKWLRAWALADPRQLLARIERELNAAKGKPDWDMSRSGIAEMVDILTVPPAKRLKPLTELLGEVWMPGEKK